MLCLPACVLQPTPQPSDDSALNALDLEEAIRSLDSVTAALVTDVPEEEAAAVAAVVAAEREAEEKREREEVEMRRSTRSHKASKDDMGGTAGRSAAECQRGCFFCRQDFFCPLFVCLFPSSFHMYLTSCLAF